jgi:hypothetical protein
MTNTFDTERGHRIAKEITGIIAKHAALTERTGDPLFLELIHLSRQWWLRWLAIGLCEMADLDDGGDLADELRGCIGDVEAAIIERAGQDGYDRFTAWAVE